MDLKTEELINKGKMLPLMEEFYTIQGEGFYSGNAAYFIRFGGCDVGCSWCDVKESWDEKLHPLTLIDEIINRVKNTAKLAVITGGEPLMWNLDYITQELHKNNIQTNIETSGAHKMSGKWDWICLSPKRSKLPLDECYEVANELKMVIHNKGDFKFAEKQAKKVNKNCLLLLQPEWSTKNEMTPLIIDYVKENPQWKISLQTHKYLDIP
ncbi:MAG: 7-carboxy-7-deazaguanine synthase QueE [Tenacibaculum sp.]|nr:7-carboxy-7-deazaguanine synthase QueE [Tenacibaculum sp.]